MIVAREHTYDLISKLFRRVQLAKVFFKNASEFVLTFLHCSLLVTMIIFFVAQLKSKQPRPQECVLTEYQTARITEPSLALDSSLDGPSTTAPRPVDFVVSGNNINDELGFVSTCFP